MTSEAQRARDRKRYLRNRDAIKAATAAWALKNKEKADFSKRAWNLKHKKTPQQLARWYELKKARYHADGDYRDRVLAANRHYRKTKPENYRKHSRLQYAKRRAWKLGAASNPRSIKVFVEVVRVKEFAVCYYCERLVPGKEVHFDHIVPLSKGGAHSIENLCVSCPHCNQTKLNKPIHEWMKLGQQLLNL